MGGNDNINDGRQEKEKKFSYFNSHFLSHNYKKIRMINFYKYMKITNFLYLSPKSDKSVSINQIQKIIQGRKHVARVI